MRRTTRGTCVGLTLIGMLTAWTLPTLADVPGTRPTEYAVSRVPALDLNSLDPVVTEIGRISVSIDGAGTVADSSIVQAEKPAGTTVRRAFLTAVSAGFSGHQIADGEITIDGSRVNWGSEIPTAFGSNNYFTEITSLVSAKLDAAPAGRVDFTIREGSPGKVDGVALIVIFDDPAQTDDVTAVLFFGAQSAEGDRFSVGLASPLDTSDPDLWIDFCIGISYSFQSPDITDQFSLVNVNGKRLTSSAGGQDDGTDAVGSLFTIGGLDDSAANPDSLSPPLDFDTDDERYDLVPYVENGDTRIIIETVNPSFDDNVFFACLTTSVAAGVGEALILSPSTSVGSIVRPHTVTATFQDALGERIGGALVAFEVFAGPNAGTSGTVTTDANGRAEFSYSGTVVGTDSIRARTTGAEGEVLSNVVSREWNDTPDDFLLTLDPVDSRGAVGFPHMLSARLTNGNNTEAGRSIVFDVFAGPHSGESFTTTTGADGIAEFQYTGTSAGVDSIIARVTIGDIPPTVVTSNIAAREWTDTPDDFMLTLEPVNSSGAVGSLHTLSAQLMNNSNPEPGRQVAFEVFSGPNAGLADTATTDASGVALFEYTGTVVGVDSVVARATIGSVRPTTVTSNLATRQWTPDGGNDAYLLTLTPERATGPVTTRHTVTAIFTVNGAPRESQVVNFSVYAGPHSGLVGLGTTDVAGQARFTYVGQYEGVDSIVATVELPPQNSSGALGGAIVVTSNIATMLWTGPQEQNVTLEPKKARNPVGTRHTVTATVLNEGMPIAGAHVAFAVTGGPHDGITGVDTTSGDGEAFFSYVGVRVGVDNLRAVALVNGIAMASNVATSTWTEDPGGTTIVGLDIKPTSCVNPINIKSRGVTPAALLGGTDIDVHDVDVATLRLEGVPSSRHHFDDVSRPGPDEKCGCSSDGPDGYLDMTLKFDTRKFVAALGPVTDREIRTVTLTGKFKDGSALVATDCILIIAHDDDDDDEDDEDDENGDDGDGGNDEHHGHPITVLGLAPPTPNPFNPTTSISYRVPADGHVRLTVYDVTGRSVVRLVDAFRASGEYTVDWTARGLASGVYFYRLESGGQSVVRRAILLK